MCVTSHGKQSHTNYTFYRWKCLFTREFFPYAIHSISPYGEQNKHTYIHSNILSRVFFKRRTGYDALHRQRRRRRDAVERMKISHMMGYFFMTCHHFVPGNVQLKIIRIISQLFAVNSFGLTHAYRNKFTAEWNIPTFSRIIIAVLFHTYIEITRRDCLSVR